MAVRRELRPPPPERAQRGCHGPASRPAGDRDPLLLLPPLLSGPSQTAVPQLCPPSMIPTGISSLGSPGEEESPLVPESPWKLRVELHPPNPSAALDCCGVLAVPGLLGDRLGTPLRVLMDTCLFFWEEKPSPCGKLPEQSLSALVRYLWAPALPAQTPRGDKEPLTKRGLCLSQLSALKAARALLEGWR